MPPEADLSNLPISPAETMTASAPPAAVTDTAQATTPVVVAEAPVAAVVDPVVAPIAETPAVEPPVAEPVAPAEPAKADEKAPEHPKSLLTKYDEEKAAKEAADKAAKMPDEPAKPGEEAKPAEGEKQPAEPVAEEAPLTFELPAQLKAAPEQLEEFGNLLRSTKTGDLKESGQKLLDMHAKSLEAYAKEVSDHQWKVWNDMIAAKDKEVLADPIIGGAGHDTAMAAIVKMRDLLVPEGERGSFTEFLNTTGAGSWPVFLRMMHRAAEYFHEPPMPAPGGKPPRDAHLPATGGRFGLLHDHPSSQIGGKG